MKLEKRGNQSTVITRAIATLVMLSTILGVLSSCSHMVTNSRSFDYRTDVGWIHGACLAIANDNLTPGEGITMIILGVKQSLLKGSIVGKATSGANCYALLDDRRSVNDNGKRSFYSVLFNGPAQTDIIAIGLVHLAHEPYISDGIVRGDLVGDGRQEVFTYCQATEGINFFVWSETVGSKLQRWTDYYYLGYEITSNCTEQ